MFGLCLDFCIENSVQCSVSATIVCCGVKSIQVAPVSVERAQVSRDDSV